MYFELDGSFPHHEANPIDPATLVDLQARVLAEGADLGLAFDGDADRCFVVDERGELVSPSALTALIAERELAAGARQHGDPQPHHQPRGARGRRARRAAPPVRTRVGHSFIKAEMARTGAVFGGEHSGHFYFREFWNADSGMLAALHALAALGHARRAAVGAARAATTATPQSGEVNSTVDDAAGRVAAVRAAYGRRAAGRARRPDRRPRRRRLVQRAVQQHRAAAAPQRRGAATRPGMERVRDEVLALIRA